jgi:hypothetical protein
MASCIEAACRLHEARLMIAPHGQTRVPFTAAHLADLVAPIVPRKNADAERSEPS